MAEDFIVRLQRVEQAIGALRGSLPVGTLLGVRLTSGPKRKVTTPLWRDALAQNAAYESRWDQSELPRSKGRRERSYCPDARRSGV